MNAVLNFQETTYYPDSDGKPMGETDFHIQTITYLYQALTAFFSSAPNIKVFADIMFYYQEGYPRKVISPDVMVVRGIDKNPRRSYKIWEEKLFPEVVFEISSRETWADDLNKKKLLYEKFGVSEYFIFDPEYSYLTEPFLAFRLENNRFRALNHTNHRVYSEKLGLEVVDTGKGLKLFDPQIGDFLYDLTEAEFEIKRLRAEIERLKKSET